MINFVTLSQIHTSHAFVIEMVRDFHGRYVAVPKLHTTYDDVSCSVVHDHSYQRIETSSILGTLNINVLGKLTLCITSSLYRHLCIEIKFSDDCESSFSSNDQDDNTSTSDSSEFEDGEDTTEHQTQTGRHIVELEVLANALDNGYLNKYIIYL